MKDTYTREEVYQAIASEQMDGECPPELFALASKSMEDFLAYTNAIVEATKLKILKRLDLEPECACGDEKCTGEWSDTCGYTIMAEMGHAAEALHVQDQ